MAIVIPVKVSEIYGTGIASVEQTQTSHESGGVNEITVTLTNGQTFQFYVENGQEGGTSEHALRYDPQVLTAEEQAQARTNIDAAATSDIPTVPTDVSAFYNDAGYITSAPVSSVNGQTGAVVIGDATTLAAGLMSATDKANLDTLMDDYTSALTALGVI